MADLSLLAELKQRKLVQWALAYAAAAFALLQGVDMVAAKFGWPASAGRYLILAAVAGFFVTLLLAWYHGERGAQKVSGTELALLTLLLAIGGGLMWKFGPGDTVPVASRTAAPDSAAIDRKSIAVLPFENLSDDKANAYFATGMQDEILTRLAGIRDLKVISRTSTEQYASHPPNLRVVAEQLGVATVLEGSVQRSADKVRINLQLIDARTDTHLWAQKYDRELKDVFAVQSDVSEKVAEALQAQLLPAESTRIASVPTKNPAAYDQFLKAEYFTRQFDSDSAKDPGGTVRAAAELYASAIALDPEFALAQARLAYLRARAHWNGADRTPAALDAAQVAAERALALQPDLPQAHLAMGYLHYWGRRDYAAALAEFATARASLPNDAAAMAASAYVHRRQGELTKAIEELRQAAVLDPRDTRVVADLGDTLGYLRRYAEAEASSERALALAPDNVEAQLNLVRVRRARGDLDGASRALAAIPADTNPQGAVSLARFEIAMAMRQPDAALAALANAPAWMADTENNVPVPLALLRGQALAQSGDTASARAAFAEALQVLQGLPPESRDQPAAQSNVAFVHLGLGEKAAALAAARRATELLPQSKDLLDGSYYLARLAKVEAQVGEAGSALTHVEELLAAPAGYEVSAALLRGDPVWDPLRKDARFQALIAKAGKAAEAKP